MTPSELITHKIHPDHPIGANNLPPTPQSDLDFRIRFAGARRELGDERIPFSVAETAMLSEWGFPSAPSRPRHIHGRVLLLLQAARQHDKDALPTWVHSLFVRGDTLEQCAILCALPLLPNPEFFVDTAAQATRGYVREVFDTLACHNPYPAQHLPETTFNQMILKALFLACPLDDVMGLQERNNAELQRMVQDFARERRLAGRPVPADTALII